MFSANEDLLHFIQSFTEKPQVYSVKETNQRINLAVHCLWQLSSWLEQVHKLDLVSKRSGQPLQTVLRQIKKVITFNEQCSNFSVAIL